VAAGEMRRELGAMLGRLPFEALLGARFDLGTGLGKLRQTIRLSRVSGGKAAER
jgi:hypothetical protein